jgi:multisubunit Na+/H+ antiporter MnhB subunit
VLTRWSDWCGAEYDAYKVVIDVYVVLAVCAVGFVGNALTVAVLRRDNDPTNTTNWLLQSLAFTDTLYLLSALVIQVRLYDGIVSYYVTQVNSF